MKQIEYSKLYPQRKDGRYQANYKDDAGVWHTLADRDPERLHTRLAAITDPKPYVQHTVRDDRMLPMQL